MADNITNRLFELRDENYREFHSKLVPNLDKNQIIGIRIPVLRGFARSLTVEEKKSFIQALPHKYYEENNLHGYIIEDIKDFNQCINELDCFLPYIDNWATCDTLRPKCFKKHKKELIVKIYEWLNSEYEYTVRFAIGMLMLHFLDDAFCDKYPLIVSEVKSDKYYVNMMIAWYFATALSKKWDEVIPYITNKCLSPWVHNKAIQKSLESYRITTEQKEYLKKYRI